MGPNITVEENWTPEPELMDRPPRRVEASDAPDLNAVNLPVFLGGSGVAGLAGIVLFILGLAGRGIGFTLLGLLLIALGIAALIFFPARQRQHLSRGEHLVSNGIPVAARLLSADILNGSATARVLRYQVAGKDGELIHKQVNADDSVLPKRIPSNVTALLDINSGDVELYLALPFRAVSRTGATAPVATPAAAATPEPSGMGTVSTPISEPVRQSVRPGAEEEPRPRRETYE